MALNVICFLWGGWPGEGRGADYVRRLRDAVARNLPLPHRFIAFCDAANAVAVAREGVEVRPLDPPSWRGCLPKLYAYSPDAGLAGRVLILDLDNVIVGDLTPLARYSGPLAVRAQFRGWPAERVPDGDMIGFAAGSETAARLWADATRDPAALEHSTGGRERYFLRRYEPDLWQALLGSRAILSYKRHMRGRDDIPEGARIISCHDGAAKRPTCRPHQLREAWVRRHWR